MKKPLEETPLSTLQLRAETLDKGTMSELKKDKVFAKSHQFLKKLQQQLPEVEKP